MHATAAVQTTPRSDASVERRDRKLAAIIYRSDIAARPRTWSSKDDANEVARSGSAAC